MLEDLRNHDAKPTPQEREWMAADPLKAVVRIVVLAGLAVAIGLAATPTAPDKPATVAAAQR